MINPLSPYAFPLGSAGEPVIPRVAYARSKIASGIGVLPPSSLLLPLASAFGFLIRSPSVLNSPNDVANQLIFPRSLRVSEDMSRNPAIHRFWISRDILLFDVRSLRCGV